MWLNSLVNGCCYGSTKRWLADPETESEWLGMQSVAGAPPFSAASKTVTLNYKDSSVDRPHAGHGNGQASVVRDFVTLRTTSPPASSLNFLYKLDLEFGLHCGSWWYLENTCGIILLA